MSRIEEFLAEVEQRYSNEADPTSLTDAISELRSHLNESASELQRIGFHLEEAEREAIKRFGSSWKTDRRLARVPKTSRGWAFASGFGLWLLSALSLVMYSEPKWEMLAGQLVMAFGIFILLVAVIVGYRSKFSAVFWNLMGQAVGFVIATFITIAATVGGEPGLVYIRAGYHSIPLIRQHNLSARKEVYAIVEEFEPMRLGQSDLKQDPKGHFLFPVLRAAPSIGSWYFATPPSSSSFSSVQWLAGSRKTAAAQYERFANSASLLVEQRISDFDLVEVPRFERNVANRWWNWRPAMEWTSRGWMATFDSSLVPLLVAMFVRQSLDWSRRLKRRRLV